MTNNQEEQFNLADLGSSLPAAAAALSAEDRAGLVNALKNKLEDLSGRHPNFLDSLSANVRKRVDVLKDIQSQHDELEAKYLQEKAELEAKYQKLYEPLYTKRYEIVNGLVEVEGVSTNASEDIKHDESTGDKGVPSFWLTAMKSNDVLAEEISESDEGALQYLKDIKWCRLADAKGFKLEFFFDTNPYFKNSVLTKAYEMINEEEHILERAVGTEIEWLPGKNLTQKVLRKKPKKGSKSPKPPITKTEECESFFNFFKPPQIPEDEDEIDEDTAELLQNEMEHDYDIGSTIRDKIIPHAVSWFTGEAAQSDEYEIEDDEDDEDYEEDEDDEDEDEDDDDDDDEEDGNGNGKKK